MADIDVSAASTSNLIVAFSQFTHNANDICTRLIELTNRLVGEEGGRLTGGDGERAAEIIKKFQVAVNKLGEESSAITKTLDAKLSVILGMDKGGTASLEDMAKKDVNAVGNIMKKH